MPAIAPIILANGETVPVNHTFNPLGQDVKTGIFWFEDTSPRVAATSSIGYPRIGIRTKRELEASVGQSAKNAIARTEVTFAFPQLETVGTSSSGFTPAPTIAYVDRVKVEFIQSSRDVVADRKDNLSYCKNILSNALVVDIVQNLTSLY